MVTDIFPALLPATVARVWGNPDLLRLGFSFSLPTLLILLCHELGHWFACRRHGLRSTPPYFLPAPVGLGTFGAFIRIRSPIRTRRQLLDVGVSGPIAGFLVLVPILAAGVAWSQPVRLADAARFGVPVLLYRPGESLLLAGLTRLFHGPLAAGEVLDPHPFLLAGWVGLFVTMLNLLPLAQLDGGHILFAVAGRYQRRLVWLLFAGLLALGFAWPGWWLWCALVVLIGLRHPRLGDESEPLDRRRRWLAAAALAIFVVGFMPVPIRILEFEALATSPGSRLVRGEVEHQRHRAVVEQLDGHARAEAADLDGNAAAPQGIAERGDERLGVLRTSGALERRTAAALDRSEQGELRDQKDGAAGRGEVEVQLAVGVVEDPQAGDLLGGRLDRGGPVAVLDPGQDEQAAADLADALAGDFDVRAGHPLQDQAHRIRPLR